MKNDRRGFLKTMGTLGAGAAVLPSVGVLLANRVEAAARTLTHLSPQEGARDEVFWTHVRKAYSFSPDFINLENGFYSPSPTLVLERFLSNAAMINEIPSFYMRRRREEEREDATRQLAEFAGCSAEEIMITRNTTEALDTIIHGLHLREGDEAIMTNQDYPNMLEAFRQEEIRRGVKNIVISLPLHPLDSQEMVHAYERAITPRTKIMLVTHMINITGQVLPVREICDMAHQRGVEVIVDAAHTFAHLDYKIPDLHCDYFGTSLHKWLCAPLGTGMMYIRKDRIRNVWPLFGDITAPDDDIKKFERIGTHPASAVITVPDAIRFHTSIGSKLKEERLRYIKNYWAERVRDFPGLILNTPLRDDQSCGIANFSIAGRKPAEIVDYLFTRHRIFTVEIDNEVAMGVRVTPHVYTNLDELDLLVQGIKELCQS